MNICERNSLFSQEQRLIIELPLHPEEFPLFYKLELEFI